MKKLEKIIKGIWTIINSKIFLLLVIVGIGTGFFKSYNDSLRDQIIADQNEAALNDSILIIIKDNGTKQATIDGFILTEKNLKDLNKNLANQVKSQEGKIITLTNAEINLTLDKEELKKYIDSITTTSGVIIFPNDSTANIPFSSGFKYDSINYDIFTGYTSIGILYDSIYKNNILFKNLGTSILKRETVIGLTFGQKIVGKKLRIFIESNYPGFTAKSLEGVFIDPDTNPYIKKLIKRSKWFNGFNLNVSLMGGYDLFQQKPMIFVGFGISYNIYEF